MVKYFGVLKRHKRVSGALITLVCALAIGAAWMVISSIVDQQEPSNNDAVIVQPGGEVSYTPENPAFTKYSAAQESIDKQDWAKAVEVFRTYGDDDTNPRPLRITAYANCAWAAQNNTQPTEEAECLEAGRALLAQLSDIDRIEAQKAFEAIAEGKTYSNTDVAPGDIRE